MIEFVINNNKLKRKKKTPAYKQLRIWSAVATGQSKQLLQPLVFEIIPRCDVVAAVVVRLPLVATTTANYPNQKNSSGDKHTAHSV